MERHEGQAGRTRVTREEFGSLYERAYPTLRLVAAGHVGAAEVDDVVQRAAIVALERLGRFERGTNFEAWMAALVRGVARNERRAGKRRVLRLVRIGRASPAASGEISGPDSGSGDGPGGGAGASPLSETIRNALGTLGPQQRSCFLLRVVMQHSYAQIAVIEGIPEATARSYVHRARRTLLDVCGPGGCDDG